MVRLGQVGQWSFHFSQIDQMSNPSWFKWISDGMDHEPIIDLTLFDRPKFRQTFLFDTPKLVRVACCASGVLHFLLKTWIGWLFKSPAYSWHNAHILFYVTVTLNNIWVTFFEMPLLIIIFYVFWKFKSLSPSLFIRLGQFGWFLMSAVVLFQVKDQTYFLSHLSQAQLKRLIFPLGCIQKVRWGCCLCTYLLYNVYF